MDFIVSPKAFWSFLMASRERSVSGSLRRGEMLSLSRFPRKWEGAEVAWSRDRLGSVGGLNNYTLAPTLKNNNGDAQQLIIIIIFFLTAMVFEPYRILFDASNTGIDLIAPPKKKQ